MEIKNLSPSMLESYKFEDTSLTSESYVSKDLMKSATIENLLSQNEDLMSRLKAAHRRMATLEDLNQELQSENFQQKNQILNYTDQVQILKEKDLAWKSKVDELEQEKDTLAAHVSELENLKAEVERYKKYHDKIRFQVKPYIQSLKSSRDEAVAVTDQLRRQLQIKDSQLNDVRHQMQEVLRQSKNQIEDIYRQKTEVVTHLETEIKKLKETNVHLEKGSQELQLRMQTLNKNLEAKAELENRIIELERSKIDLKSSFENEILRLQSKVNDYSAAQARFEVENSDLKRQVQEDYDIKIKHEQEMIQMRRQLESLRFMWNQKNDEVQRSQKSLEALEKLNISLSEKVEGLRHELEETKAAQNSSGPNLMESHQI